MPRPILGFVGAGKVGQTLARLWSGRGYSVGAVSSRTPASAEALAAQVGAPVVPLAEMAAHAELILLTVPDDQIGSVVDALAKQNHNHGRGFLHTSGAFDASLLAPLAEQGARVGSLHPAFPFADTTVSLLALPGSTFAYQAEDPALRAQVLGLIASADGRPLPVPEGQKARYHAALVLASNYTVTLYALAQSLLLDMGADRDAANAALNALVGGTIENLRLRGIPDALTGPLTRGDLGTLQAHLQALTQVEPRLAHLYMELARLSFPMLEARGVETAPIAALLSGFAANQE